MSELNGLSNKSSLKAERATTCGSFFCKSLGFVFLKSAISYKCLFSEVNHPVNEILCSAAKGVT